MTSTLEIHVEFSFRGETHCLRATVDLDDLLSKYDIQPPFHEIIAQHNKIDTYSYLYEVMEQAEIVFEKATGLAAQFINEGLFDFGGFAARWREDRILDLLKPIAQREIGVDLDSNAALARALLEAYRLGKSSSAVP